MSPRISEQCVYSPYISLANLFNRSLDSGQVLIHRECGMITPVFKARNRPETANYRCIALLPTTSTVLDEHVMRKLVGHLGEQDLISSSQLSSRKRHPCLSHLSRILADWPKAVNDGNTACVCFPDRSEVFDRADHNTPQQRLKEHGIRGLTPVWLANYPIDWTVPVRIDSASSDPAAFFDRFFFSYMSTTYQN